MKTTLTGTEEYDNYDVRPKLTKPYPVRALDACASLNIDLQKVDDMLTLRRQSPWMTDPEKKIFTSLRCLPKGAGKQRIRTEMQQLIEDERLNEYEHIYTDGSFKEEQVGCAVVMPSSTLKYRLLP
jgi:hypothetical protein